MSKSPSKPRKSPGLIIGPSHNTNKESKTKHSKIPGLYDKEPKRFEPSRTSLLKGSDSTTGNQGDGFP